MASPATRDRGGVLWTATAPSWDKEGDAAPTSAVTPAVVLLVDDQELVAMAVGQLLAGEPDLTLHSCSNPLEAVAVASRLRPAVILLDLVMPGLDGFGVLSQLRANPATGRTPVVVLSGNNDESTRAQAFAAGADDCLAKLPVRDELLACLRRHAAAPARADGPAARSDAARPAPAPAVTLDRSVIAAFLQAGTPESATFTRTVIDQFLDESRNLLEALAAAAAQEDAASLRTAAHTLKGAAMTLGAARLAVLAGQTERHAARLHGTVIATLLAELRQEFSRVHEALEAERRSLDSP